MYQAQTVHDVVAMPRRMTHEIYGYAGIMITLHYFSHCIDHYITTVLADLCANLFLVHYENYAVISLNLAPLDCHTHLHSVFWVQWNNSVVYFVGTGPDIPACRLYFRLITAI